LSGNGSVSTDVLRENSNILRARPEYRPLVATHDDDGDAAASGARDCVSEFAAQVSAAVLRRDVEYKHIPGGVRAWHRAAAVRAEFLWPQTLQPQTLEVGARLRARGITTAPTEDIQELTAVVAWLLEFFHAHYSAAQ